MFAMHILYFCNLSVTTHKDCAVNDTEVFLGSFSRASVTKVLRQKRHRKLTNLKCIQHFFSFDCDISKLQLKDDRKYV